jgi:hypothetical protein
LTFALISAAAVVYAGFDLEPGAAISQTNAAAVIRVTAVERNDMYDNVAAATTNENLDFHVKLRGSCDEGWKVQTAVVRISGENKAHKKSDYLEVNPSLSTIGYDNGTKWSFQVATVSYLPPNIQSSPVAICNAELERRLARGDTRTEVLSKGFDLTFPQAYFAELSVQCARKKLGFIEHFDHYADAKLPVTISCMPTDYKPPHVRTVGVPKRVPPPPPPIASVIVDADPKLTQGRQCPLYVNFRGKIFADETSTYETLNTKFRFLGDNGYESEWIFVPVKKDVPKSITGRRFIQAPQIKSSGPSKASSSQAKIPLYNGWMMAEVMLPNGGVRRSDKVSFTVDCNAQSKPARPKAKP